MQAPANQPRRMDYHPCMIKWLSKEIKIKKMSNNIRETVDM